MQGICALTNGTEPCYLALPSQSDPGSIRICNAAESNHVLAELSVHKSKLVGTASSSLDHLLVLQLTICRQACQRKFLRGFQMASFPPVSSGLC